MWVAAIGAILIGLPYVLGAFGPTEAEVRTWGTISIGVGAALALLTAAFGGEPKPLTGALLALAFGLNATLQLLPAVLWAAFHGSTISDGSPPTDFVAHWGYGVPHAALFAISELVVLGLVRSAIHTSGRSSDTET